MARRAFKELDLGAIIESLVPDIFRISQDREDVWDKNRYVSRKRKWGGAHGRICQRAPPFAQIRTARPVKNILSRNIRARIGGTPRFCRNFPDIAEFAGIHPCRLHKHFSFLSFGLFSPQLRYDARMPKWEKKNTKWSEKLILKFLRGFNLSTD